MARIQNVFTCHAIECIKTTAKTLSHNNSHKILHRKLRRKKTHLKMKRNIYKTTVQSHWYNQELGKKDLNLLKEQTTETEKK